ncbi:MAG: T9SS type A sorting domain-containing protein [Bacteroidota bacterium]
MDDNSNTVWEQKIQLSDGRFFAVRDITTDENGNIYAVGSASSQEFSNATNAILATLDEDGQVLQYKEFPHPIPCTRAESTCTYHLERITVSKEGNLVTVGDYVVSGGSFIAPSSDISIMETDTSGKVIWEMRGLIGPDYSPINTLLPAEGNSFFAIGTRGISDTPGRESVFFVKLDVLTHLKEIISLPLTAFPNPTQDLITIQLPDDVPLQDVVLRVYDAQGKRVQCPIEHTSLYTQSLPKGMYWVNVQINEQQQTLKFVKQ